MVVIPEVYNAHEAPSDVGASSWYGLIAGDKFSSRTKGVSLPQSAEFTATTGMPSGAQ